MALAVLVESTVICREEHQFRRRMREREGGGGGYISAKTAEMKLPRTKTEVQSLYRTKTETKHQNVCTFQSASATVLYRAVTELIL